MRCLKPFVSLLVSWAIIFSAFPAAGTAAEAVVNEAPVTPADWVVSDLSSDIYTVERLPVESSVMTPEHLSQQTFAEQVEEDRPYEENCILVTIAHEYSLVGGWFSTVDNWKNLSYYII